MHILSKEQIKKVSKFKKMTWDKFTTSFLIEDPLNLEAFLYSKALFNFPRKERNSLLKELEGSIQATDSKICFQYLHFSFGRADWFYV